MYSQEEIDLADSYLNLPPKKDNRKTVASPAPPELPATEAPYRNVANYVTVPSCGTSSSYGSPTAYGDCAYGSAHSRRPYNGAHSPDPNVYAHAFASAETEFADMMIPDTARTFPELSDGVSRPNCAPEQHMITGCDDFYFDVKQFEQILYSDDSLDVDLYPSALDEDFYRDVLNEDQYLCNFQDEPYQDRLNAAVIEAAALKSFQVLISPELCHIVNPNEIFPNQTLKKNDGYKLKVCDDVVLNNALSGESGAEIKNVKKLGEVHNDHSYVKEEEEEVVVKVELEEEEEVFEEDFVLQNVVVKVEAPAAKRPVGRPRKTPAVTKPVKRLAAHFDEETNEEIVDVESIDVKRPRKAPKAKPAPKASTKKAPAQKRKVSKPSIFNEEIGPLSHFQAIDPLNPNGYVMRQAKTTALKKIAKTKKSPTVSRSKRSDHNDMERRRRHEMRNLFESLKFLVPTELLVDDNNKIKKNPSKNTILVGSRKYVEILYDHKMNKNSSVRKNQKLQKKHRRLAKALRKRCKKLLSRRNVC